MGSRPSRRCAAIPTENKPEKAFSISSSSSCPSSHECPVPGASPSVAPFSVGWRQPTISGRRPFSRRSGSESTSQFRTDGGGLPIVLSREKTDGAERKHGAITHPEASTAAKKQTNNPNTSQRTEKGDHVWSRARALGHAEVGAPVRVSARWISHTRQRLAYATHVRLRDVSRPGISLESHLLVPV